MLKFTMQQMNDLTEHQKLLIINFSLAVSFCSEKQVVNCYSENVNLLEKSEYKLKLNKEELDFIHSFFLENDYYWTMKINL